MNAYGDLIKKRALSDPARYPQIHFFPSKFYFYFSADGHFPLRNWTQDIDLFATDLVLVPIHLGNNWCAAVINFRRKRFEYYDSLHVSMGQVVCKVCTFLVVFCTFVANCHIFLLDSLLSNCLAQQFQQKLRAYLEEEWKDKNKPPLDLSGWQNYIPRDLPSLQNGYDSGVFACIALEYAAREEPIDFAQEHMPYLRMRMVWEFLRQELVMGPESHLLNADAELAGRFGRAAVAAAVAGRASDGPLLHLATLRDDWPTARAGTSGLSMRQVYAGDAEYPPGASGPVFVYVHSGAYAEMQRTLVRAQRMHSPDLIMGLLARAPWHVDALLVLAEISRAGGRWNEMGDTLSRALCAMERAWHPAFRPVHVSARASDAAPTPTTITPCLPYRCYTNRALHLALMRWAAAVAARGAWRAALECAKLALSLDENADPLGALLVLDHYASKAGELTWLLDFYEVPLVVVLPFVCTYLTLCVH